MRGTLLVIDDDVLVRDLIADLLTGAGYSVLTAASGREGVRLAATQQPEMILVDYSMPEMDGEATVRALKRDAASRCIPVIALTAATGAEANRLIEAGCLGFIPKPVDGRSFGTLVAQFLRATTRRPSSG